MLSRNKCDLQLAVCIVCCHCRYHHRLVLFHHLFLLLVLVLVLVVALGLRFGGVAAILAVVIAADTAAHVVVEPMAMATTTKGTTMMILH